MPSIRKYFNNDYFSKERVDAVKLDARGRKILEISIFILFIAAFWFYAVGLFIRVPLNSDYANLVLEAADIVNGNIFLSGWNLTGISFITTDMLFFITAVLLVGSSVRAYYVAVSLMFLALFLGGIFLCKMHGKRPKISDILILLAVGGLPCVFGCDVLRAHTAVPAYLFFALFFARAAFYSEKPRKAVYLIVFILLITLGCAGDPVMLLIGVVPIVLVCGYNLLTNSTKSRKWNLIFIILSLGGAILGKLLDIIFISVGDTNKNTFLSGRNFGSLGLILQKTKIYLESILGMSDAMFLGQKLISLNTLWYFLRVLVVLFAFFIMFRSVWLFIRRKNVDLVSVVLSIGFLLMTVVLIFTDVLEDIYSARYIGYFPLLCGVLIVRFLKSGEFLERRFFARRMSLKVPVLVLSAVLTASSVAPVSYKRTELPQDRLADFLIANNLHNGYGKFWNASSVTLLSEGAVNVRAIIFDGGRDLHKFNWFCKDAWYYPHYSNFVVIENAERENDPFKITPASVVRSLGKPAQILTVDIFSIYVYDRDITDEIIKV